MLPVNGSPCTWMRHLSVFSLDSSSLFFSIGLVFWRFLIYQTMHTFRGKAQIQLPHTKCYATDILSHEIRCVKPLKQWLWQSEHSGNVSYYDYIITAQTKGTKSYFCQSVLPSGKLMYPFYLTFWNMKNSKCLKVTPRIPWSLGALTSVGHWIPHLGGCFALSWVYDAPRPRVSVQVPW